MVLPLYRFYDLLDEASATSAAEDAFQFEANDADAVAEFEQLVADAKVASRALVAFCRDNAEALLKELA